MLPLWCCMTPACWVGSLAHVPSGGWADRWRTALALALAAVPPTKRMDGAPRLYLFVSQCYRSLKGHRGVSQTSSC